MGILVAASRAMYLTGARNDLEYKIQLINTARLNLMNEMNSLTANGADLDPESPEVKIMEQRRQRLMLIDKKLEMEMQQYQSQLQMVQSEEEGVRTSFQKNVERAYRT
jgi:hypothetical protein